MKPVRRFSAALLGAMTPYFLPAGAAAPSRRGFGALGQTAEWLWPDLFRKIGIRSEKMERRLTAAFLCCVLTFIIIALCD